MADRSLSKLGVGGLATLLVALVATPSAIAAFPGANGRIAFLNYPGGIFSIRPNGDGKKMLAKGVDPSFSPDGRLIAFSQDGLQVMHADGSHVRRITSHAQGPSFSPSGRRIVFSRFRGISAEICTIRRDGTDRKVPVPAPRKGPLSHSVQNFDPVYSPNGHRIVFWRVTHKVQLFSVHPNGTHLKALPGTRGGEYPDFSPDGRRIVFTRGQDRHEEIYSLNLASSRVRQLTHNRVLDDGPAYSPDGHHIVVDRKFKKLISMRPNGSHAHLIGKTDPNTVAEPSWGVRP